MANGKLRCDEVVAVLVLRAYDEHGRPIDEQVGQQMKFFRAKSPDFWASVDRLVAEAEAAKAPPPRPPAATQRRK
jgi:hypothetical protein